MCLLGRFFLLNLEVANLVLFGETHFWGFLYSCELGDKLWMSFFFLF